MIPPQLGHYRLFEKLGEGGMGVVYKAIDTHLDRPVALKILPPDKVADSERKRRFVLEAKAASALNHPNIVTIHDISADQGVDFLVMEFIDGKTLDQIIPRQGMRLGEMLRVATQIAEGLLAAHAAGITHRDLKPSNIMVGGDGRVKILDFGLAKLTDRPEASQNDPTLTNRPHTTEGTIMGTVCYMSPEQAEGKKIDARSDIFSFGAVLYEMASGQRAFHGDTPASTLGAVIHKDPKPLTELTPVVPRDLDKLVARCLRKDRDRRYQGMADLRVALLDLKEESDSGSLSAAEVPAAPAPRRGWRIPAVALGTLAFGTVGALLFMGRPRETATPADPVITQITRDAGVTFNPSISPDGKLLAYASDRAGGRNVDIWVQQLAGGQPVRLTRHPAGDFNPQFSPDGTTIYFLSRRPEGAVWAIPALGGDERVLTKDHALFGMVISPDGRWLAFNQSGVVGQAFPAFLLSSAGGNARQVAASIQSFYPETWSADSRMLIGWGKDAPYGPTTGDLRLYAVPAAGGQAILLETSAGPVVTTPDGVRPSVRAFGNHLYVARPGAIERYALSGSWKLDGPLRRWPLFAGASLGFCISGNTIAAAVRTETEDIWSIPMDAIRGKVTGPPERLTNDEARDWGPSLSDDGRKLIFTSDRLGNRDVWLRDMATGKETQVTVSADSERRARISPDGTKVAMEVEGKPPSILVREIAGGEPKLVCRGCSLPGWTPDSARVVYWDGDPIRYNTFDPANGERKVLVSHPTASVQTALLSPDGRWVSFRLPNGARTDPWIAPVRNLETAPRPEWVAVLQDVRINVGTSWWSPDGNLLYFLRFGSGGGVWAQALDPASKRPRGDPFPVFTAPPGLRFSPVNVVGLSTIRDRMVLSMVQDKSNLWRIELPSGQ